MASLIPVTPYTATAYARPAHGNWRDSKIVYCAVVAATHRYRMIDGRVYRLMRTADGHIVAVLVR